MEKLGISLGMLIVNILSFGIVFVVLKAWAFKPILKMLDQRRQMAAQAVEDAKVAAEAKANAESEAQRIISEAQAKASELMRDANQRASLVEQDIKAKAVEEVQAARENALNELQQEKARLLSELRGQIGSLAIAASQKLIGNSLKGDETQQRALLDEFFSGVQGGKFTLLQDERYIGSQALVTSAVPLKDSEKSILQNELKLHLTDASSIAYKVDPAILGGVIVRLDDKVVDGSVIGQLDHLRQSLN